VPSRSPSLALQRKGSHFIADPEVHFQFPAFQIALLGDAFPIRLFKGYAKVEICASSSEMHQPRCLIVSLICTCGCSTNSYMHAALWLTSGMRHRCHGLHTSACLPRSCSTCPSDCEAMRIVLGPHDSQTSSGYMPIHT
jgi:hypothetical protein